MGLSIVFLKEAIQVWLLIGVFNFDNNFHSFSYWTTEKQKGFFYFSLTIVINLSFRFVRQWHGFL